MLQGQGEHNLDSGDEVSGYLNFKTLLQRNYIQPEPLYLTGTNGVPADCNLLIIPGPRNLRIATQALPWARRSRTVQVAPR